MPVRSAIERVPREYRAPSATEVFNENPLAAFVRRDAGMTINEKHLGHSYALVLRFSALAFGHVQLPHDQNGVTNDRLKP
jgi:hypothetical protein